MLIIEPTQEELPSGALSYLNGEFVRFPDGLSLPIPLETLNALKPANYTDYTANRCSTPVVENGVAYKLANENSVVMFKLSAPEEDRLKPEIVKEIPFNTDRFPYYYNPGHVASPLLHEGLLYCVNTFGVLMVMDVAKGKVVYQRLLDLDIFMPYNGVTGYLKGGASASPTLAGKYIYILGNQGTCIVIEPGRTYKQIARNRIEYLAAEPFASRHQEATISAPIFEGDRMYIRGEGALYCIGPK